MESSSLNTVDRPSLYWYKKYLYKVTKNAEKNIDRSNRWIIYKKFAKPLNGSFWYFMPFFIGYFLSLFQTFKVYGSLKSASIFNKRLYHYFWRKSFFVYLFYFLFGPILLFVLLFFFPLYSGIDVQLFFDSWSKIFKTIFTDNFVTSLNFFVENVVFPVFNSYQWIFGIFVFGFSSCINLGFLFALIVFNVVNDKMITLYTLEDNLKMKISRFAYSRRRMNSPTHTVDSNINITINNVPQTVHSNNPLNK